MIEQHLKDIFQLSGFRTGQREIINAVLDKKDVLAVLPTGGGKSLCYQLPIVHQKKLGIVVSPLVSLMKDQVNSLKRKGLAAGCLYSGQSDSLKREIFSEINKGGTYLLYLSPERVQKEGFQKWIMNKDVALFAVDEAHCVSQWGHDFRTEYSELNILKVLRPDVPILALTASATPTVLDDIAKNLKLDNPEKMVHGFYRPNLYYQVETCASDDEKIKWLLQAIKQFPEGRIIVYCGTRKVTEELAEYLSSCPEIKLGSVGCYHAGLGNKERSQVQEDYTNGYLRILVATNAFGMGIDQPDVRLVVHYQMPANIDSLYQEMGRAGRDGKESTCLMLYAKKDKGLQSFFVQSSRATQQIKNLKWRNLDTLVAYSESNECRHAEILTYYKDSQRLKKCGHCDSCDPLSVRKIQIPIFEVADSSDSISLAKKPLLTKKSKVIFDSSPLTPEEDERFQVLRRWRKQKADELDSPAFVILADKSLRDLAKKNPQSLDELEGVYGIGEAKREKFGWDILAELKK